ncbi:flavodoxin family protein, partial [Eubacteriales bacterium DFI.9.88]|nr:flavodoxin family protein [Eubacteriales bacterium DFI.9.88]
MRNQSNSELLADSFIEGAKEAGHAVEKISLKDKNIGFCKGCLACQEQGKCVIEDDAIEIAEKMKRADVIVYATPIYYYEMSWPGRAASSSAHSFHN